MNTKTAVFCIDIRRTIIITSVVWGLIKLGANKIKLGWHPIKLMGTTTSLWGLLKCLMKEIKIRQPSAHA